MCWRLSSKKNEMKLLLFLLLIIGSITLSHCDKNNLADDESILYGTWVKGNKTGDTLTLVKKGGKNMILYNMSNNPEFHAPNELEYSYRNGKFSLKGFPAGPDFSPIDSFKWKQVGKEFEIEGTLLFPFLALSTVIYTYKKI